MVKYASRNQLSGIFVTMVGSCSNNYEDMPSKSISLHNFLCNDAVCIDRFRTSVQVYIIFLLMCMHTESVYVHTIVYAMQCPESIYALIKKSFDRPLPGH